MTHPKDARDDLVARVCSICGEPMPTGEEMFKYHGHSGPCPKPPLPKMEVIPDDVAAAHFDLIVERNALRSALVQAQARQAACEKVVEAARRITDNGGGLTQLREALANLDTNQP